jgi:hypothetical protein
MQLDPFFSAGTTQAHVGLAMHDGGMASHWIASGMTPPSGRRMPGGRSVQISLLPQVKLPQVNGPPHVVGHCHF